MIDRVFPYTQKESKKEGIEYPSVLNSMCRFPMRMIELRTKAGLSQQKLADELGVSKSTISLYETGDTIPDIKTVVKLSKIYNVTCDYIACQTDYTQVETREFTAETMGLSEVATSNIITLDKKIASGQKYTYPHFWSHKDFFNRLCEHDSFQEIITLLSDSCEEIQEPTDCELWDVEPYEASDTEKAREEESLHFLLGAGYELLTPDNRRTFLRQKACNMISNIVEELKFQYSEC